MFFLFWLAGIWMLGGGPSEKPVSKKYYPQGDFAAPVDLPVRLTATFGELRANHFHAGLDIKSKRGRSGDPVYSVAEGHVARISVKSDGYGQCLYLSHPNGYTTVYAHLDRFAPELEAVVREEQYRCHSFEVELDFPAGKLPVLQGQEIGRMGNTGHSQGPHLHFEVRDSKTDIPINPLLFGIPVESDVIPPSFYELKVYELNAQVRSVKTSYYQPFAEENNTFRLQGGDTIRVNTLRVGLGVKAYDKTSAVSNRDGIYGLDVYKGDTSHLFGFEMDAFGFDETLFINAHCDYTEHVEKDNFINRCYRLPGNQLSIYTERKNDGIIELKPDSVQSISIAARDFAGNVSQLQFFLQYAGPAMTETPAPDLPYNYVLTYNQENLIKTDKIRVHFPECSLYEELPLQYSCLEERRSSNMVSPMHRLHNYRTPVHLPFEIAIRPYPEFPDSLRAKAFVAYCNKNGRYVNCGGTWQNGLLVANVQSLGDYCIMIDRTPPGIRPAGFKKDLRKARRMSFRISDNHAVLRNVAGLRYNAYVDGSWILMEFDRKSATLKHEFDGRISPGEHRLRLVVTDALGNTSTYEAPFIAPAI